MTEDFNFKIYKSNKLENFLPEVCKIIKRLAENAPLKKKSIIVQSDGMARWLTLKAATDAGVFANFEFVSPDGFLRNFAEKYFGITPDSVYNKKNAEWALYSLLKNGKSGAIGKYIGENEARAFRLSRTLADMIEQYFVYRPNMMKCWFEGKTMTSDPDESWQFGIFRELADKESAGIHGFAQIFNAKCKNAPKNADYPAELILFGISIMNKYQLDMFRQLSRLFPVHIFSFSPSQAYFSVSKEKGDFKKFDEDQRFSTDNLPDTFFGRFCAAGLDFFNFLLDNPSYERDFFEEPEKDTLLASIQRDILTDSDDPEKAESGDGSVQIISCRDKMREIEVLKDILLELFNKNEDLKPEDIAVMAPKINDYVPYITAVFGGTDPTDKTFVPWVVSDRIFSSESRIAATFLEILRLAKSDFEKSRVLSIFRSPCVLAKFNTDDKTADEIEKLIDESGIRWGLDASSRGEKCGNHPQNTWDFGLSRIMMSFIMPFSETGESFEDILPMESVSTEDLENISKFITFVKELFRYSRLLSSAAKTPAEFKNLLEEALDFFFACDKSDKNATEEIRHIKSVIDDFAETAGKFTEKISFDALLQYLDDELGIERPGRGFLSAKVNFCSLKPLRALPFKVIYLIGMGDGAFPRSENRYAFDLTQKKSMKEPGAPLPRSVRESDKYLFVEAIVSAREKLFISYEAKDLSEDSKKHRCAALPVQILEKYIEKKTGVKAADLEIKYPLQPFSEEYFKEGFFKTFSKKDFELASAMFHVEQTAPNPLPELVSEQKTNSCVTPETEIVDLEKLIRFFKNPIKFYLTKTLKIALSDDNGKTGDEELFDYSDTLLAYNIRQTYVDMARSMPEMFKKDPDKFNETFIRRIKNEGKIPFGTFGEEELKGFFEDSSKGLPLPCLAGKTAEENFEIQDISLKFDELSLELTGRIKNIKKPDRMILVYPVKFKEKYQIEVLIRHIAAASAGINADTEFFCNEKACLLKNLPEQEAKTYLAGFLKLWKFTKDTMPLFDPGMIGALRIKMFHPKKGQPKFGELLSADEDTREVLSSFFEKTLLERNNPHSQVSEELLLAAEQFFKRKQYFLNEFPAADVREISTLLEKTFYEKEKK